MLWRDFKLIVTLDLLDKCAKIFHGSKTQARTMVSTAGG